ncbi:phospholipase D-like domain-containing protein [Hymenobacter sp. 15J16-1T3B]|uniref:phospholipase D-like domain-containing protein n=1 Tax=Hymenobacter sp. 15J16-1T3B TaxID=2886941 RepID=UPI001D119CC5|nr:phospholipase D-like domain-containing protein [Hymenobacter sp. 15J16-1T3B]MCC3156346.1 phospholipase D-like domain-containing protein [Hymenobacter sp. 15J16-1T3B]
MPHSTAAADPDLLLNRFSQALQDATLSATEAQQLREAAASFAAAGGDVAQLRRQVFELAKGFVGTPLDKAVINWLAGATALLPGAAAHQPQVYFSPGDECVGAIRRFIGQAAAHLDVCVFTVADDRLTQALLAAHRRGVRVRLITDNDKLLDRGSDVRELQQAGVPVRVDRTADHMHHKFAVADHRAVLTGSYNWTRSAALYNLENLLITDDPAVVQPYDDAFDKLWHEMAVFEG